MTLTIELTPETERRVRRLAAANGESVQEYFLRLLSKLPEATPSSEHDATVTLFQHWAEEDDALTPEEVVREDDDWRHIEANLQAGRLSLPVPDV